MRNKWQNILNSILLPLKKMKLYKLHFFFLAQFYLLGFQINAQFSGPPGTPNCIAIHKDSSVFCNWAKYCFVQRGLKDISIDSLGYADLGVDSNAIGVAGNAVVSLGDGGVAVLTFNPPITNGPDFDFAVFENSFSDFFLELAFIEVSSDGINFFRFPATSNMQNLQQIGPFDLLSEPEKINNLAGKYRALFGTPFDLEELSNLSGLDINYITHIKVVDVVGTINPVFASFDQNQQIINDPYPTPFSSGGFDLDAIGVIHQLQTGLNENNNDTEVYIYPNPAKNEIFIKTNIDVKIKDITLTSFFISKNATLENHKIDIGYLPNGFYFLNIKLTDGKTKNLKFLKID